MASDLERRLIWCENQAFELDSRVGREQVRSQGRAQNFRLGSIVAPNYTMVTTVYPNIFGYFSNYSRYPWSAFRTPSGFTCRFTADVSGIDYGTFTAGGPGSVPGTNPLGLVGTNPPYAEYNGWGFELRGLESDPGCYYASGLLRLDMTIHIDPVSTRYSGPYTKTFTANIGYPSTPGSLTNLPRAVGYGDLILTDLPLPATGMLLTDTSRPGVTDVPIGGYDGGGGQYYWGCADTSWPPGPPYSTTRHPQYRFLSRYSTDNGISSTFFDIYEYGLPAQFYDKYAIPITITHPVIADPSIKFSISFPVLGPSGVGSGVVTMWEP